MKKFSSGCLTPMSIKLKMTNTCVNVPCGKCPKCLARRTSSWSFRLIQEEKTSETSFFLTITYNTDHVPITKNRFLSLDKKHVQLFIKRLRFRDAEYRKAKGYGPLSLKYFACGEYGTKSKRPHYHIILFNAALASLIGERYAGIIERDPTILDGKTPLTCLDWEYGHITLGHVSGASVGYTLKYINKGTWHPMHANDDRQPQFQLMSKGLGKNYLTENMVKWHLTGDISERVYLTIEDGKKIAMPRYYKDKIYNETQRKVIAFRGKQRFDQLESEAMKKAGDDYFHNKAVTDLYLFSKLNKDRKNQSHEKI